MTVYTNAIEDMGLTLITLLEEGFKGGDGFGDKSIILASPGDINDNDPQARLCLFLYQVKESAYMKSQEVQRVNKVQSRYPPLYLDLHYMLLSYSPRADLTERTMEEHKYMGKAMQILYDAAALRDPVLKGELAGKGLEIRLTLDSVPLDDLIKLWQAFQTKPFRPSVCYLVSPIIIESSRLTTTSRVIKAEVGGDG